MNLCTTNQRIEKRPPGFTLIELLIVVLIIAILAAIAVPNFLEFQTRAKVSRAMSDIRTIATALEAYNVDNNDYPLNDGVFNVVPISVTTPISYISTAKLFDPFVDKKPHPIYGDLNKLYTYTHIVDEAEATALIIAGVPPPSEGVDAPFFNPGALNRYGPWRMLSQGPDQIYSQSGIPLGPFNANVTVAGSDVPYDPTNGTVSFGNILRTQKSANGIFYESF